MADSLPGLGIVAAVLGVVITMGALGGPKEEIGHRVAAALVGTFLGILLCYGLFGPLAQAMSKQVEAEAHYFGFLADGSHWLRQGAESDHGDRTGAAVDSVRGASHVPGDGGSLPGRRRGRVQGGIAHGQEEEAAAPVAAEVVIIRRKKGGHGGHHGGAWKVAYADFVTAMMALFIVLWLMSSDKEVQESVSAYFNNPSGPGKMTGTAAAGLGNAIEVPKEDMDKLAEKIQEALMTGAQLSQSEGPCGDYDHFGRIADRAAGDRGGNVLRVGKAGPDR